MRPFSPEERAAFGAELRFAACRFAVTRITDVHLKRAAVAPGGKDFNRYLARLGSVEVHLQGGDSSESLSGVGSFTGVDREVMGTFHTIAVAPAGAPADGAWGARWTGTLVPDAGGAWTFGVAAIGRSRVLVDDRVVADGFAVRNVNQLNLRESEEMRLDREYLEQRCALLESEGIEADCLLAAGDPGKEIAGGNWRHQ